ncbi:hypothetical protein GII36_00510 [Candidatus Mycosynbacter amalyticus]|uniref:Uncharacterized protein n=1 Tax=Candidatus Mycosynbacter amalyticus TaxID=2665156 RepID=A0A857MNS9_9BACT|nr:hypothetical protein [Candidatus Mycosynbacter amalyticus]QHN42340.1 hypothetical protein GII36_00510 [Candidatus Mycosynbacter amalyticus]
MSKAGVTPEANLASITSTVTLLPLIGLFIVAAINTESNYRLAGTIAGYVMYMSLLCSAVLFLAIFKLPGKSKVLPIVGLLLALAASGAAYLTHWFNV